MSCAERPATLRRVRKMPAIARCSTRRRRVAESSYPAITCAPTRASTSGSVVMTRHRARWIEPSTQSASSPAVAAVAPISGQRRGRRDCTVLGRTSAIAAAQTETASTISSGHGRSGDHCGARTNHAPISAPSAIAKTASLAATCMPNTFASIDSALCRAATRHLRSALVVKHLAEWTPRGALARDWTTIRKPSGRAGEQIARQRQLYQRGRISRERSLGTSGQGLEPCAGIDHHGRGCIVGRHQRSAAGRPRHRRLDPASSLPRMCGARVAMLGREDAGPPRSVVSAAAQAAGPTSARRSGMCAAVPAPAYAHGGHAMTVTPPPATRRRRRAVDVPAEGRGPGVVERLRPTRASSSPGKFDHLAKAKRLYAASDAVQAAYQASASLAHGELPGELAEATSCATAAAASLPAPASQRVHDKPSNAAELPIGVRCRCGLPRDRRPRGEHPCPLTPNRPAPNLPAPEGPARLARHGPEGARRRLRPGGLCAQPDEGAGPPRRIDGASPRGAGRLRSA